MGHAGKYAGRLAALQGFPHTARCAFRHRRGKAPFALRSCGLRFLSSAKAWWTWCLSIIFLTTFPPNSKVWGSFLKKGTRRVGWVACGSVLGARGADGWARGAGWVACGSELGSPEPDRKSARPRHKEFLVLGLGPDTKSAGPRHSAGRKRAGPRHKAPGPDTQKERRFPTQSTGPDTQKEGRAMTQSAWRRHKAPRPDTQKARRAPPQSAGPRHKERRAPTQRAPGPDTEHRAPTAINMR